jgi:hypothetical protein
MDVPGHRFRVLPPDLRHFKGHHCGVGTRVATVRVAGRDAVRAMRLPTCTKMTAETAPITPVNGIDLPVGVGELDGLHAEPQAQPVEFVLHLRRVKRT